MTLVAGMVALAAATGGGELTAGPVMAGDGAAWAVRTRSGAVRVLTKHPGATRVVRRRWAPPRDRRSSRAAFSIAADRSRLAAVVATCTPSRVSPFAACTGRAFAGPFAKVRGPRLPDRVPQRCPSGGRRNVREVATGGGWTAALVDRACPPNGIESANRLWIEARGPKTRRIPLLVGSGLRLAGDFLAWSDWSGGVVLYDLRRGERVRKLGDGRGPIAAHDVQADGTLALARYADPSQVCVSTVTPAGTEQRVDCRFEEASAGDGDPPGARTTAVAISAGRVLYLRNGIDLVLQRPGGEPTLVTRFTPQRLRAGAFDVGPRTVVWAEQRSNAAQQTYVGDPRVVLKRL